MNDVAPRRLTEDVVGALISVTKAEVIEVRLPLLEPFVTGFGTTATRRTVLVRLEDGEGYVGWGEAAALDHPYYLSETTATTLAVLSEYALPLALALGPTDPRQVAHALARIRRNTFARTGVEASFWTLHSARRSIPLWRLFGGRSSTVPPRIAVGESIGIKPSIAETLYEVESRLAQGYSRIKLKIRPGWDLRVVEAVRLSFGSIMLQVDANASYMHDHGPHLQQPDAFDLAYDDLLGHAELQATLSTPICLDESLRSPADVRSALDIDACRNVNLKPGRVGGIAASLEIHQLCFEAGIPLWCGGMLESGIGRAPNLALCTLPGFTHPADMSPSSVLYQEDLVHPSYEVDAEGSICVSSEPGLGYEVNEDLVEAWTVQRLDVPVPDAKEALRASTINQE